ncbi:MAG: YtxH domain-containing protein [Bacteroidota bacterium]|nr:YtxH domain-containing protein [Bacteroidota bacterium]MDQ3535772.1 YtxH domain-containing protein [Bacteroidota bacterium]
MKNNIQFLISLLSGITLGAIIALLYSPEKGSDNYKNMVDFAQGFAKDFISQGKEGLEATAKKWQN